jgi:uncharacterized protein YcsI (UPF0317 family)
MTSLNDLNERSSGLDVRLAARSGRLRGHTSGLASEYVQTNCVIVPEAHASDFLAYCWRNPVPCPVLAVSDAGNPALPSCGADLDIRTDIPSYRVWRSGEMVDEVPDITAYWRLDLVTFLLGCSFSFEHALLAEGIKLRHVEQKKNVSMFRTNIETTPFGPFGGNMVVTMRPMRPADAIRAVQITSRTPMVHGAPVHLAHAHSIGIHDLAAPDYGDAVDIHPDEIPVFWGCGVTPQVALLQAKLDFCITHSPGCMLVTDMLNKDIVEL